MSVELEEPKKRGSQHLASREQSRLRLKARQLLDRWARGVITSGGFAVIASIVAILLFILIEVSPLFQPAEVSLLRQFGVADFFADWAELDAKPVATGLDENMEIGYVVLDNGVFQFFSVKDGAPRERFQLENIAGEKIASVWQSLNGNQLILGTDSGNALQASVSFNSKFFESGRTYRPEISESETFEIDEQKRAIVKLSFAGEIDGQMTIATLTADDRVVVFSQSKEESLFGDAEAITARYQLERKWSTRPLSVAIDGALRNLYVGTAGGRIYHWNVFADRAPEFLTVAKVNDDSQGVTGLEFLIGQRTLLVGESSGKLSAWFLVRDSTSVSGWRLTRIHEMSSNATAVTALAVSARGKGFVAGDKSGNLTLQYTTSERLLAGFRAPDPAEITFAHFAPKANGAMTIDGAGKLSHWAIHNPHPEASFKAFFGKIWYEGYPQPEYVWQSTGGTDDFEPKLSLVPLIFGSFKGTLYALIIAIPLAVLAAIYTSQFMDPRYRNYVKPTVEIMAALPSVVLGFLAGLWLAPIIEDMVPAVLTMLFFLPLLIVVCSFIWRQFPQRVRSRLHPGVESLALIPIILLGIWLCVEFNGVIERLLFDGNFKQWIFSSLGLSFDQRNALVVGFVMGFAVIPIIFTISEDALSNVPRTLVSGSLALGATPWQTAIRVVLPTAAAGIFSAIMIGFGRAVGETMIVLMATGNTPIMDWNIFSGFRTLSANIAVEIPEAPVGGTLYRVLFMAAFLLFIITFFVNTLAELVRQRLRERYQKL
jgi:phosphate transport system permease protein